MLFSKSSAHDITYYGTELGAGSDIGGLLDWAICFGALRHFSFVSGLADAIKK
jgi:hypothetical protein